MGSLRILPLLILVALLSFVVRLGDIVTGVRTTEQVLSASAVAADDKKEEQPANVTIPEGISENEPAPLPKTDWADPETIDMQFTETQTKIKSVLRLKNYWVINPKKKKNVCSRLLKSILG